MWIGICSGYADGLSFVIWIRVDLSKYFLDQKPQWLAGVLAHVHRRFGSYFIGMETHVVRQLELCGYNASYTRGGSRASTGIAVHSVAGDYFLGGEQEV